MGEEKNKIEIKLKDVMAGIRAKIKKEKVKSLRLIKLSSRPEIKRA
jgi:hypothetical protein